MTVGDPKSWMVSLARGLACSTVVVQYLVQYHTETEHARGSRSQFSEMGRSVHDRAFGSEVGACNFPMDF